MNAAFHFKIEQTKAFLVQGQLGMAQGILNELETENGVQSRWKDHYLGIIKMRQGAYDQAINLFSNTLNKNGHYLTVILDLASCYFITGQIYHWQRMVELATYEYQNNKQKLAVSQRIQSCVLLTKYLEEKGLIFESLAHYQDLLTSITNSELKNLTNPDNLGISTQFSAQISSQIVRLHGQYGLRNSVLEIYQDLCVHHYAAANRDGDFDIQHALMIYELQFFGVETALDRFQHLIDNPLAQSFELQRVQGDFFYELLARGYHEQAFEVLFQMNGELSFFARAVLRLTQEEDIGLQDYMDCVSQLTPAAHLRLLNLWAKYSENPLPRKRQKLLTDLFSKKTKAAWENYFKTSKNKNQPLNILVKVESNLSRLEISPGDQTVHVSQSVLEIFELFMGIESLTIQEVCGRLQISESTDSEISKLRLRISRLNDFLQTELGIRGGFKLEKTHLRTILQISSK